jgi:hypothetical protein
MINQVKAQAFDQEKKKNREKIAIIEDDGLGREFRQFMLKRT